MSFILFLVVKANLTTTELVAEDYYDQEITYQDKIDAKHNAKGLDISIRRSQPLQLNLSLQ